MTHHTLSRYKPVADAIAQLFYPSVEVVIHDIITDTVYHIANPFSGRAPGDISLLKLESGDLDTDATVIGPYEKAGEKGQRVRSITAVLKDSQNTAIGLMCINLDYSAYEPALDLLETLIRPPVPHGYRHPEILFQNDWRDQIKIEIRSYLVDRNLSIESLTTDIRKEMIVHLHRRGLFYAKKSIEQVAAFIGVSRATVYNDLQAVRKDVVQKKTTIRSPK